VALAEEASAAGAVSAAEDFLAGAVGSAEEELQEVGDKMNAEKFLTSEEQERIQQVVIAAEKNTSGEIVPMIVSASGPYAEIELSGLVVGLVLGTLAASFWHDPWGSVQIYLFWPHTGILIFASLLEHRVVVLADRGINEKVEAGTWNEIVNMITESLKSGDGCDGFCKAIDRCGVILAQHFPRSADDRDELPNKLVTEQ